MRKIPKSISRAGVLTPAWGCSQIILFPEDAAAFKDVREIFIRDWGRHLGLSLSADAEPVIAVDREAEADLRISGSAGILVATETGFREIRRKIPLRFVQKDGVAKA